MLGGNQAVKSRTRHPDERQGAPVQRDIHEPEETVVFLRKVFFEGSNQDGNGVFTRVCLIISLVRERET